MTTRAGAAWINRAALAALCLLLAGAVMLRVRAVTDTPAQTAGPVLAAVGLGEGVSWAGTLAERREVLLGACWAPALVEVVEPSPHGRDASLVSATPGARVFYAYRGAILSGRLAVTELIARHFAGRAAALLTRDGAGRRDNLAVKMTLPADCGAAPEDVLAALRRDVASGR